ncbi:MAG TPA: DUF1801 domain-containing protein [Dehalococcoidia bacterium]|jgi:uncharacterized protein YdhG (YjbR/CyaY superfamily)
MDKPPDIDAYLAGVPEDARATLEDLRRTVRELVPDAVETISYGMPTFQYRGEWLFYFAAAKKHCAIYGTSRGTMRFPPGQPPSREEIEMLLSERIDKIEGAEAPGKGTA